MIKNQHKDRLDPNDRLSRMRASKQDISYQECERRKMSE